MSEKRHPPRRCPMSAWFCHAARSSRPRSISTWPTLQDKSSPNYQKWLTPDQFGMLYGPADSDIAAIVAWLESHGLKVEEVSAGRTNIAFSGTVRQVEEALHTSIHSYDANGEQFLSNTSNPVIPAALASVVSGVAHLNTIRPRPHHVAGSLGTYDTDSRRFVSSQARAANGLNAPRPALTGGAGTSTSPYILYMVAGDAATIYNTPNSFNANNSATPCNNKECTGTGVTIGIGGDAVINAATVANYWIAFLGQTQTAAAARLTITYTDNVTSTNDTDEAYIDTQLSGALAPGAAIHYYASTDLYGAINAAVNDKPAVDIFSLSFGLCENFLTSADNQTISGWWQQAAAQGMAVTVSTGDSGSAGCDNNSVESTAAYGLSVNGFATTPYNIAVGGTDFSGLLSSFTTYVSTTNDSASFFRTALGPIPESTWNDSIKTNGLISANVPFLDSNGLGNIVGGGGGASSCATNSSTSSAIGTCTGGYPKPAWQRSPSGIPVGTGVPADGVRDIPDISLMSGAGADNASWLVCTDESGPNGSGVTVTANCANQSDGHFYFFGFGGTSTAAPAFAGILALLQQKTGGKLGQAAPGFYDLLNGAHASTIFHDITVGNISVPCASGTPDCASNSFLAGYDTTTGYDLATGIGSIDVTQLITNWGSATPAGTPTVTATPSATTIASSAALQVAVTVTGSAATPTGQVVLLGPSYSSSTGSLCWRVGDIQPPGGLAQGGRQHPHGELRRRLELPDRLLHSFHSHRHRNHADHHRYALCHVLEGQRCDVRSGHRLRHRRNPHREGHAVWRRLLRRGATALKRNLYLQHPRQQLVRRQQPEPDRELQRRHALRSGQRLLQVDLGHAGVRRLRIRARCRHRWCYRVLDGHGLQLFRVCGHSHSLLCPRQLTLRCDRTADMQRGRARQSHRKFHERNRDSLYRHHDQGRPRASAHLPVGRSGRRSSTCPGDLPGHARTPTQMALHARHVRGDDGDRQHGGLWRRWQ